MHRTENHGVGIEMRKFEVGDVVITGTGIPYRVTEAIQDEKLLFVAPLLDWHGEHANIALDDKHKEIAVVFKGVISHLRPVRPLDKPKAPA